MASTIVDTIKRPVDRLPWWVGPVTVTTVLVGFGIYVAITVLFFARGEYENYLSPFYSPPVGNPSWLPNFLSPAILVLWLPLGFRATCYYYRKAYYRSFFWSPPACAVPDAAKSYSGETRWPFLLQNAHRYFFWLSLVVLAFLWWDALLAFRFPTGFGVGLGTLILVANATLLTLYSLSCHSCRYLCGGYLDSFRGAPLRYRLWRLTNRLNPRHPQFAWVSLVSVALTDLYVRLVSMGVIQDPRIVF